MQLRKLIGSPIRSPMSFWFFLLISFTLSIAAWGKETDNLTDRHKLLDDSTAILDQEMNRRLQELQTEANKQKISCEDPRSLRILFHELNGGRFFIGSLETWAEDSAQIPKRSMESTGSVYEGALENGWIFNRLNLASTIKVNGELIGTDKLGHFIDQGFEFYTPYRRSGYDMYPALHSSLGSEKSHSGSKSTGVISYADAMANYHGILFYHSLGEGTQSYFRCSQGQWTQIRKFTWSDYIDAGWDEGINCSHVASERGNQKYKNNIQKLESRDDKNYTCPVEGDACGKLNSRYPPTISQFVLSPECRKIAKTSLQSPGAPAKSSRPKGTR